VTVVRSQNGWPAFSTPQEGRFVRFTVAGRGFWAASPDVAVVAGEFLARFDAEVERVVLPGEVLNDWSFADRLIRGSSAAVSNHGSATAWDVNSDRHPLGAVGTFSDGQARRIRAILADITDDDGRPVLRWGGDYSGRKDEMHVEINANAARVRQAANMIRARKAREEDTMQPSDWEDHKLTAADARALGNPKRAGEEVGWSSLLRFPPGVQRLRR
jgi:hypothetical protein